MVAGRNGWWVGSRRYRLCVCLAVLGAVGLMTSCTTVTRTALGPVGSGAANNAATVKGVSGGASANAAQAGASTTSAASQSGANAPAASSSAASLPTATSPAASSSAAHSPAASATATGATSCPGNKMIPIGASYSTDTGAGFAAVGDPTEATQYANYAQQQQDLDQIMANYVNSHGGLAGCKIEMVYYDFQALGSDGFSGQSETECATFAQDDHAFAVIPGSLENDTLVTCLGQNHVVDLFGGDSYFPTPHDFETYQGYLYQPDSISTYRFGPYINLLNQYGYFGSGAKVGVLLANDGSGNNQYVVNDQWIPALKAIGITPTVFTYTQIESYSEVGDVASQFASAVLQFKAAGVNRVIFTPDGGDGVVFFTTAANSQGYTPRYALTSDSGPSAWGSTVQPAQRTDALNISNDLVDLGQATPQQYGPPVVATNATRTLCNSILSGHTGSTSPNQLYGLCGAFLFLQHALAGATAVTAQALLAGVNRLGDSLPSAGGYGNYDFGPSDHYDGDSAARVMEWNSTANAWQYVSPPEPVPWAS